MTNPIEQLNELRDKIDRGKARMQELEGQRKEILRRLRDDHGAKDAKDAAKIQKAAAKNAEKLSKELAVVVGEIEASLEEMRA